MSPTSTDQMELQRVSLGFNDGKVGGVFYVNGCYYEVRSVPPAFMPVDPQDTFSLKAGSDNVLKALERRDVLRQRQHSLGRTEEAEWLLLERLKDFNGVPAVFEQENLGYLLHVGLWQEREEVKDNEELFLAEKAFATAWRHVKEMFTAGSTRSNILSTHI